MISSEQAVRHTDQAWRTGSRYNREQHTDGKIHASALYECPRQTQLRYRRAAPTDPIVDRMGLPAQIGEAVHKHYLPLLAEQWAADPEVDDVLIDDEHRSSEVAAGPLVAHPDLLIIFTDGTCAIVELKTGCTGGKALVQAAKAREEKRAHLDQCRLGGLLAEHQYGTPMRGYWIYYIDLANPERHWEIVPHPWSEDEIAWASAAFERGLALAGDQVAPRWFGRHASDAFAPHSPCLSCEFKSGCLGKDDADPARAEAAAELVEAGARYTAQVRQAQDKVAEFLRLQGIVEKAKRHKNHLSDVVEHLGLEPGTYATGEAKRMLRWREGYDQDDGPASAKILRDLGIAVPQKRVSGHYRFE